MAGQAPAALAREGDRVVQILAKIPEAWRMSLEKNLIDYKRPMQEKQSLNGGSKSANSDHHHFRFGLPLGETYKTNNDLRVLVTHIGALLEK